MTQREVVALELFYEIVDKHESVTEVEGTLQEADWTGQRKRAVRGARVEGVQLSLPVEEEEGWCWGLNRG